MKFNYQARNKEGLTQIGTIDASTKKEAVSILQDEGFYVTRLEKTEIEPFYFKSINFFEKAKAKDIMLFARQLSLMLKSGVSLVDSLKSLVEQIDKRVFSEQIAEIADEVEGGVYFSEALAKYPGVFSNFFINMIKSGEASGRLAESLGYLAEHLEREYNLIGKIKSGMTYPIFVLVVFSFIGALGIFMVLPSFENTLTSLKVELPWITKMVMGFGNLVASWWWAMLLIIFLFVFILRKYFKTIEGKEVFGRLSLRLPLIGRLVKKNQLARFTENLSTLILAGLPITQALEIVAATSGNNIYQKIIRNVQEGVRRGENMSSILANYPEHIPALVSQMVGVGERTGRLDEALGYVAEFYQNEVSRGIDSLVDMIEPILIVVLGGAVAFLMIAIIMPVYSGMSSFGA
jgi:type IV pilus assembly protein PilC